jgi:formylglycine-generating enzyme required for sulfatase activity
MRVSIGAVSLTLTLALIALAPPCVAEPAKAVRPAALRPGDTFADCKVSKKTGREYRLPTEAEWEYVARAGSTTTYAWGDTIDCTKASYDGGPGSSCSAKTGRLRGTQPVGHYPPNRWGLYDVDGNVWQWCEDGWHPDYKGAPVDGTAWPGGDETMALLRGGAWNYDAMGLRIADRNWYPRLLSTSFIGFRVVTPLDDTIASLGE